MKYNTNYIPTGKKKIPQKYPDSHRYPSFWNGKIIHNKKVKPPPTKKNRLATKNSTLKKRVELGEGFLWWNNYLVVETLFPYFHLFHHFLVCTKKKSFARSCKHQFFLQNNCPLPDGWGGLSRGGWWPWGYSNLPGQLGLVATKGKTTSLPPTFFSRPSGVG